MKLPIISGIQQIGIGVSDIETAWPWYRKQFKMDIPIFQDTGEAPFMKAYTGDEVQKRTAVLAANLQGGGAFEIWQYTSRTPSAPPIEPKLGDLGIFAARIKSPDIEGAHLFFDNRNIETVTTVAQDPSGKQHFFLRDPYGNIFDIVPASDWFTGTDHITGGVSGCIIGVSDIDRSLPLYQTVLGYDSIEHDSVGVFSDYAQLPGGNRRVRRMLLSHSLQRKGAFSKLLGFTSIELVQALDEHPPKIFADRYWGDLGFIHLCFDVRGMDELKQQLAKYGYSFVVDSNESFDMGEASGRFTYIEDPDGTLIEFVETHKMPILKNIGWYLRLDKRNPAKPLPDFLLKALSLTRVKD